MVKRKYKVVAALLTGLLLSNMLGYYVWKQENRLKVLEVYVFPLKNGSAVFIRTPYDQRYIIGSGANTEIIRHLTKVLPFYSRRIDGIFVTDTDPKNIGGFISVIERYKVGGAYLPIETMYSLGLQQNLDEAYHILLDRLNQQHIQLKLVCAGDSIHLDELGGTYIEVLFPVASSSQRTPGSFLYSKASGPQLIMRIRSVTNGGEKSILLLGDASKKIQKYVFGTETQSGPILNAKSDVLVVSHNASDSYLDARVADLIDPQYIVYSKRVTSKKGVSLQNGGALFPKVFSKNTFNLKKGSIQITLNGESLRVIQY